MTVKLLALILGALSDLLKTSKQKGASAPFLF